MESKNTEQMLSDFEMPFDNPDGMESDFSVISHPTTNEHPLNIDCDHLQHIRLNISGTTLGPPSTSNEGEHSETPSIQNSIIHQHLEQILKENMELKDSLQQNNETLKQHFQTLLTLQGQQTKARVRHKQILDDLQQTTLSLQREKDSLLTRVRELESALEARTKELEERIIKLEERDSAIIELKTLLEQREVMFLQMEQQLKEVQTDYEQLKVEKIQLETTNKGTRELSPLLVVEDDLDYSVIHHTSFNPEIAKQEIDRLEEFVETLKREKIELMELLNSNKTSYKELEEKFENSQIELDVLRKLLEDHCSHITLPSSVASPPDHKWYMIEAGLMNSTTDYQAAISSLQKYENRFTSIDEQLGECQKRLGESIRLEGNTERIQQLQNEVECLRNVLENERKSKEDDRQQLENSQEKFSALHNEYKGLMKQWHDYQSEVQTKSRQIEALALIEKRQNQEQLDEVTAKVMTQEEVIHNKDVELLHLKNRVDIMTRENEQIPILRAQAELFQQKLKKKDEEVKKGESAVGQQKLEIQTLQTQVVQLMDEINHQNQSQVMQLSGHLRKSPIFEGRGSSSAPHSRRQSAERQQKIKKDLPECPKCRLTFETLQAAENHVEICCFGPDSASNPFL